MRRLTLAAVAAVLLASTAPVMTVTNGRPDGNGHPYVGIGLQPAPGGGFFVCPSSEPPHRNATTAVNSHRR